MTALARLSSLEQSYDQARQEFEHIVDYLDSKESSAMTHSELDLTIIVDLIHVIDLQYRF